MYMHVKRPLTCICTRCHTQEMSTAVSVEGRLRITPHFVNWIHEFASNSSPSFINHDLLTLSNQLQAQQFIILRSLLGGEITFLTSASCSRNDGTSNVSTGLWRCRPAESVVREMCTEQGQGLVGASGFDEHSRDGRSMRRIVVSTRGAASPSKRCRKVCEWLSCSEKPRGEIVARGRKAFSHPSLAFRFGHLLVHWSELDLADLLHAPARAAGKWGCVQKKPNDTSWYHGNRSQEISRGSERSRSWHVFSRGKLKI